MSVARPLLAPLAVLLWATSLSACGAGPRSAASPLPRAPEPRDAGDTTSFAESEARVLARASAADARIRRRTGVAPLATDLDAAAMSVTLGTSDTATFIDGAVDPFSFEARTKMLLSARSLADALPESPDGSLERTLVLRLIDEELARVDEERALPMSASTLVSAMSSTLSADGDLARRDLWLADRLDRITAAEREHPLPNNQRVELDDSLDPLEKMTAVYPAALAALSRLRERLEEARGPSVLSGPDAIEMYHTHVDARETSLAALNRDAEQVVARASAVIKAREARLPDAAVRRAEADAGAMFTTSAACSLRSSEGRLRGMQTSREREGACRLVRAVADTDGRDEERVLVVLLVLRDAANVSRWVTAPAGSRPSHPFMSQVAVPDARRLERAAVSHPAAALATMKAAELLLRDTFEETHARAANWEALGDLPLDLVAAKLP